MIKKVDYPSEYFGSNAVEIIVTGYPTIIVKEAWEIASAILGNRGPWHFTELNLTTPEQNSGDLRKTFKDDSWQLQAVAEMKYASDLSAGIARSKLAKDFQ